MNSDNFSYCFADIKVLKIFPELLSLDLPIVKIVWELERKCLRLIVLARIAWRKFRHNNILSLVELLFDLFEALNI